MTEPLQLLIRGDSPLIINVPHSGTLLPAEFAARMTDAGRATPDTDWHLSFLYHFAVFNGATLIAATHSRYVVDLNRDPDGTPLYPGLDGTELVPTRTFANEAIYSPGEAPTADEVDDRRRRYWEPYHDFLAERIAEVHGRHGHVVLLDAHSVRAEVPRLFSGRLPDLNLGTFEGRSCGADLREAVVETLDQSPEFSLAIDRRFKGGYITRRYGIPDEGLHAMQLEIVQACYMDEAAPAAWQPADGLRLRPVLQRLIDLLARWRPAS